MNVINYYKSSSGFFVKNEVFTLYKNGFSVGYPMPTNSPAFRRMALLVIKSTYKKELAAA